MLIENFDQVSYEIYELAKNGLFDTFQTRLSKYNKLERKQLVECTYEDKWSLFVACLNGHSEIVKYICEKCGEINVEKKGVYELDSNKSRHIVSSFWVSCVSGHLNIVKYLHECCNVDINCISDSHSTPIRSACYMSNYEIVEYLCENGADLNKPNLFGGTPLINSIESIELTKLLIKYNADVNIQDITGNCALHYAINESYYDIVKLLIDSGANPQLKNKYNEDAYKIASVKGDTKMLFYLIENTKPNISLIIDNVKLLGSYFIDINITSALLLWQHAFGLERAMNVFNTQPDLVSMSGDCSQSHMQSSVFYSDINSDIITKLNRDRLIENDRHFLRKYACYIYESILGVSNRETLISLIRRAVKYLKDDVNYSKSIDYLNYSLNISISNSFSLSNNNNNNDDYFYLNESIYIINLLMNIYTRIITKFNDKSIFIHNYDEHICYLYDNIVKLIDYLCPLVKQKPLFYYHAKQYHRLLLLWLRLLLIVIYSNKYLSVADKKSNAANHLRLKIFQFLNRNERSPLFNDCSLMHISYSSIQLIDTYEPLNNGIYDLYDYDYEDYELLEDDDSNETSSNSSSSNETNNGDDDRDGNVDNGLINASGNSNSYFKFPNMDLIKFILKSNCGYTLNIKDANNETPLFYLLKSYNSLNTSTDNDRLYLCIVNYSLNNNAHVDIFSRSDPKQQSLEQKLKQKFSFLNTVDMFKHKTLACACATVIRKHNISYKLDDLPKHLIDFIDIH